MPAAIPTHRRRNESTMSDQTRHPRQPHSRIELAILDAMREDRLSRRAFLGRAGRGGLAIGAAMTLPGLIAACQPSEVTLQWANWPLYIDIDEETGEGYPTIEAFTEATSIMVNYVEQIQDNEDFYGTIQPDLAAGNATGWDIVSPTSWMVKRMADLGYLVELDHSKLPNWATNCADYAKGLWFDSDNRYSVWWQGGITGIGYDPNITGREITSFDDLLHPDFAGRVGAFKDMRDMMCLSLLSLGIVPANATVDDATRAQQKLLEAAARGQFRGFYDNSYYDVLAAGDLVASVAWSGDITQMQLFDNDQVQFVLPAAGAPRWNDNLVIPKGAALVDQAHRLMDHYYDPAIATALSEYIGYFTPVAGVSDRILQDAQAARDGGDDETADYYETIAPVATPTEDQLANTYDYPIFDSPEEEQAWNELFLEVRTTAGL